MGHGWHPSFSSEFKRQLAKEILYGRGARGRYKCARAHRCLHEPARRYSLPRKLIRLWVCKYEAGEFTDQMVEAFLQAVCIKTA